MNSSRARRSELIFLILLTLAAFGLRVFGVGSFGLAEDEAKKWHAIQKYKQGEFAGVNSEHPMLMKVLAWGSLAAGQAWNRWAAEQKSLLVREEVWLRLPNLIFGAATTVVIYLLGKQMLGPAGAVAAAFFWAVAPLSIALNRILKEDTLLTFFTFLAFYFFWRGKKETSDERARRLFTLSGASFGLALASKYFIHYIGLNIVAWHIAGRAGLDHRPFIKFFGRFMLALAGAFVLANPVILSPTNISAILTFMGEKTVEHHGYNLDGELFINNLGNTPYGLPWYFYFWVLGVKTPLPVLIAWIIGTIWVLLERTSPSSIFLRVMLVFWFIPYSVAGAKWVRYVLILLPFVYLTAGYAIQRLFEWYSRRGPRAVSRLGLALAGILFLLVPAIETLAWAPLYPLYLNQLGGGRTNAARYFPHDELYDLGVREALEFLSRVAPRAATLAADNPVTVGYYLERWRRQDIRVVPLFSPNYVPRPGDFILVQQSRRYFETQDLFYLLERRGLPIGEVFVAGVTAARIYRF